jgi:flagellar protein FliS
MYNSPYFANSLETRVLSATPIELVQMLYDGAIDAIQSARRHLAEGRIKDRSLSIGKAIAILAELRGSLNYEKGGELSALLGGLYSYTQRILLEANFRQTDAGLAESERLLKTVREGWAQIGGQPVASHAATGAGEPVDGSRFDVSGLDRTAPPFQCCA